MKVIRCENGHYYDSDLFSRCPHCREPESGSGSGKKQGRQISFFQAFRKVSKPSAAPEDPIGSEQNAGPDATGGADGQGRAETVCEPTEILSKEEIERLLAELDGKNVEAYDQKAAKQTAKPTKQAAITAKLIAKVAKNSVKKANQSGKAAKPVKLKKLRCL